MGVSGVFWEIFGAIEHIATVTAIVTGAVSIHVSKGAAGKLILFSRNTDVETHPFHENCLISLFLEFQISNESCPFFEFFTHSTP